MFEFSRQTGQHKIYKYKDNPFIDFFKDLYQIEELNHLHLISEDFEKFKDRLSLGVLNDTETDIHKIFYKEIKNNQKFKILYCELIRNIHSVFFPNEKYLVYQSFPSVRFQFPESVTIPPHKDSDSLSNHPLGEKNFILAITKMENTASIFIESEPDKQDFKSIKIEQGELLYFNGNTCTHYNEKNQENRLRISLDFRIIKPNDYLNYINKFKIISSNPRDIKHNREPKRMMIGGYYQIYHPKESIDEMMVWHNIKNNIFQSRPFFGKEEAESCYRYILEDNFITEYKKTEELEKLICDKIKTKNCIMTTSGTIAILLGLMSLDLKENDEVIVPNFTMIATVNAIKMLKLKPVIIDIDKETCTINLEEIKKNITEKTKVILHVSLNNRYNNLEEIRKYCDNNNLILLEDSAQSLGCKAGGKYLGTYGKMGFFSLSTPKIISTGQGGFIITDDDVLAGKIRMIKNFGRRESGKDNFEIFGLNFKFNDLQAVVGIEQMKKLDKRVKRMREIYDLYYSELKDIVEIKKPLSEDWIPWFVDIYVDNREKYINLLNKHFIKTRPVYEQINKTKIYYSENTMENSDYICRRGLFLPTHIGLTDNDILFICRIIKFIKNK